MLVLSRKEGESVMIGDQIRVTVTRIDADAVKLGFTAPSKTLIYRDEIYREIKQANREALRRPVDGVGGGVPPLRIERRPVAKVSADAGMVAGVQLTEGELVVEAPAVCAAAVDGKSVGNPDDSLDSDKAP
jgi:carbon storage regulator